MLFMGLFSLYIEDIQQKPASTLGICQMPTVEDLSVAREPSFLDLDGLKVDGSVAGRGTLKI